MIQSDCKWLLAGVLDAIALSIIRSVYLTKTINRLDWENLSWFHSYKAVLVI